MVAGEGTTTAERSTFALFSPHRSLTLSGSPVCPGVRLSQAVLKSEPFGANCRKPFYEHRIAELVRPIFVLVGFRRHPCQRVVLLKRAEEFVVARARLMHAGH